MSVKIHHWTCSPLVGNEDNIIMKSIAIRSCTISIPIDILPYNSSSTPLSLRSLTMIIVLLNANAIAIYMLVIASYPKYHAIKNPSTVVKITCHSHIMRDVFHKSLINHGLSHSHTIKSNNATPRCEKSSTCSVWWSKPNPSGPMIIPAIMYPISSGCLSHCIIKLINTTIVSTHASSAKGCCESNALIYSINTR